MDGGGVEMRRKEWDHLLKTSIESKIPYQNDFVEQISMLSDEPSYIHRRIPVLRIVMSSFALLFISIFSFIAYQSYYTVVSLFTVDINPSIEVGLNRYDKVIEVNPINSDGVVLIDNLNKTSGNLNDVLDDVIETSLELGYITSSSQAVLVGVSSTNEADQVSLMDTIDSYFAEQSYHLMVISMQGINQEQLFSFLSFVSNPEATESPTYSNGSTVEDYFDSVIDSTSDEWKYYSGMEITSMSYIALSTYYINEYNISAAHFQLIMMIVEASEEYQEVSKMTSLIDLNIDELLQLYDSLK